MVGRRDAAHQSLDLHGDVTRLIYASAQSHDPHIMRSRTSPASRIPHTRTPRMRCGFPQKKLEEARLGFGDGADCGRTGAANGADTVMGRP